MNKTEATFQLYCALVQSSDLGRGGTAAEKPERFIQLAKQSVVASEAFASVVEQDDERRTAETEARRLEIAKLEVARKEADAAIAKADAAAERARQAESRAKDALFKLEQERADVEQRQG